MYRRNPARGVIGGLTGGIFLIGLAIAFFSGHFFLTVLFITLAFTSLLGFVSSFRSNGIYGGLHSFVWLFGLGILFLPGVAFWPLILVLVGISAILGALRVPIMAALL